MTEEPIDIVYTYVNGGDEDYQKLYMKYANKPSHKNPERYRDIYSMIKYSIRSVEMFAPWIRNIYIVTIRPQIPDWLDTSNPRIKVIHHDEIFDEEYLPTFNYNVIESYVHRIPGLSDRFIYSCDDQMFANKIDRNDFFADSGKIKIFGTFFGENLKYRIYEEKYDYFPIGLVEHTPFGVNKEAWEDMSSGVSEKMHKTRSNKFREGEDLCMLKLYRAYMLSTRREECETVKIWDSMRNTAFHKITNDYAKQVKRLDAIKSRKPKILCLNDDQRDDPNVKVIDLVKEFLESYYSKPSQFEKKPQSRKQLLA